MAVQIWTRHVCLHTGLWLSSQSTCGKQAYLINGLLDNCCFSNYFIISEILLCEDKKGQYRFVNSLVPRDCAYAVVVAKPEDQEALHKFGCLRLHINHIFFDYIIFEYLDRS